MKKDFKWNEEKKDGVEGVEKSHVQLPDLSE